jgi:DNA-binding transcriptional LysR family regulator
MHIHARSLNYFDMIRRCGSIREAARRLHVASSAVNRQLLKLEEEVGAELFERLPSGLKLTTAGEIFAGHVITVLQDEQRLVGELDSLRGLRRGDLGVLGVEGLNSEFLPVVLERMLKRYPLMRVRTRTTGSTAIAQAVIEGEADVGLGFSLPHMHELRQSAVGRFRIGAVVPADHPLARQRQVTFSECARYPLILSQPTLSIQATLAPLILHHKKPITVLTETDSIELMKNLAIRGLGVAFQTRFGMEYELNQGLLVHVPLLAPTPVMSELGVYVRARRPLPPALEACVQLLSEELVRREAEEAAAEGAPPANVSRARLSKVVG